MEFCSAHWLALLITTVVLSVVPFFCVLFAGMGRGFRGPSEGSVVTGFSAAVLSYMVASITGIMTLVGIVVQLVVYFKAH